VKIQEMEKIKQYKHSSVVKKSEVKDLTYHIKLLVQKTIDKLLFSYNKTPFTLRAIMKILVLRSRGLSDLKVKINLSSSEVQMLSNIFIAGWLNTGYRNPKSFGLQSFGDKELELEFEFFRSARITFEHLMMMQLIPDTYILGIDVEELNFFINKEATKVIVYWESLL
jgi:hypothetical protein